MYLLFSFLFIDRTNLPKEVMCYPEIPFDLALPSYVTHEDVRRYLEQYADKFDLLQCIKVNKHIAEIIQLVSFI